MSTVDPYAGVADALVASLEAAAGDPHEEHAAITAAIAGYLEIAGGAGRRRE